MTETKRNPQAATPGLRTLGTTATSAAAGNDSRLSDSRTPGGAAGGDLGGTFPNPTVADHLNRHTALNKSSAPVATAALEVAGTDGGLLVPRLTTTQRDALTSPPDGLQIYNTTNAQFEFREDGSWSFGFGAGSFSGDATSLQGEPVDSATPNADDVLTYDGSQWTPQALGSSGSAWPTRFGTVTVPVVADFPTVVNQGSETATDNAGVGIDFWDPGSGSDNWTLFLQAVPGATPWTAEGLLTVNTPAGGGAYARCHLVVRNAANAFLAAGVEISGAGSQAFTVHTWSSVTNAVTTHQNGSYFERYVWVRVKDTGVNLEVYLSADGKQFGAASLTIARSINTSGNPTLVGVGINNTNTTGMAGALLSWRVF